MQKLPQVSGLVLCERMEVDPSQGAYSLVNLFNQLRFPRPGPLLKRFTVYGTLLNGVGEGLLELVVMQLHTERDIYKRSFWYAYPDQMPFNLLEMKVNRCPFPAFGRYRVSLRIDRNEIAYRLLDILPE